MRNPGAAVQRVGRYIGRSMKYGSAYKAMAGLGLAAFGPPCPSCEKPMTRYMHPRHREATQAALDAQCEGKTVEDLAGVCHCNDEVPGLLVRAWS